MNCHEFEEKLHLLADPAVPDFVRKAGDAHAVGCERCRCLLQVVVGDTMLLDPAAAGTLAASILRRTSGTLCDRIDATLCDWVDGQLSEAEAELLHHHLDQCAMCASTASVLAELRQTLPMLAEVEPDARFVRDVLDRTAHAARRNPARRAALDRWLSRLAHRPRMAQEIAYVTAVALFLGLGARSGLDRPGPADPSAERIHPVSAAGGFDHAAGTISDFADAIGEGIEDLAAWHPTGPLRSRGSGLVLAGSRIDESAEWIARGVHRAAAGLIRLDTVEIWSAFEESRDGIRNCWRAPKPAEPSGAPLRSPRLTDHPADQGRLEEDENHEHDARGNESD